MLRRFLLYGVAGWAVEVLFTGVSSAVKKDRSATAQTYLWMHPIYGATALLLELVSRRTKRAPRWARALAYTGVIYLAEYSSGWLLRQGTGKCPWNYTQGRHVHGLVRLDYAPAWYALALLFEPMQAVVEKLTSVDEPLTAAEPAPLRAVAIPAQLVG